MEDYQIQYIFDELKKYLESVGKGALMRMYEDVIPGCLEYGKTLEYIFTSRGLHLDTNRGPQREVTSIGDEVYVIYLKDDHGKEVGKITFTYKGILLNLTERIGYSELYSYIHYDGKKASGTLQTFSGDENSEAVVVKFDESGYTYDEKKYSFVSQDETGKMKEVDNAMSIAKEATIKAQKKYSQSSQTL